MASKIVAKVGLKGKLGMMASKALAHAGTGALIGGGIGAATGQGFWKGATAGAVTGAITGGVMGAFTPVNPASQGAGLTNMSTPTGPATGSAGAGGGLQLDPTLLAGQKGIDPSILTGAGGSGAGAGGTAGTVVKSMAQPVPVLKRLTENLTSPHVMAGMIQGIGAGIGGRGRANEEVEAQIRLMDDRARRVRLGLEGTAYAFELPDFNV